LNPVEFRSVSFAYEDDDVLSEVSVVVPTGVTSLAGPNGAGKSTFLLLASGRVLPRLGTVLLLGEDTASLEEVEKNRLCSLVYQNMEFETEEPLGDLLHFVYSHGFLPSADSAFFKTVVKTFELSSLQSRKTQTLSKGEMQRAVMAFSLLYGSRVVVMDEPVFALEDAQKRRALGFVSDYARSAGVSFLYSAHELELTRDFCDRVLLFPKGRHPLLGSAEELLSPATLEDVYQVPYALLHQKERLYRSTLLQTPTPREILEQAKEGS
jgi:ABC-type cobalamin/Fe3+-siderophores transport system ATPase subunit